MKFTRLLILPLSLAVLTGCPKPADDKIAHLHYGQMASDSYETIDYQSLSERVANKETFLVAVYAEGCSCWSTFQSVLSEYIRENHVIVYAIGYKQFHSSTGETLDNFGLKLKAGYTSFAIFKEGKAIVDINSEKKELKEVDAFKKLMESSVTLPKIFYISKDQVDELYSSSETSLLYFARSNCQDCQYFDRHVLDSYETSKNIYILDCEKIGIREYDEHGSLTPESQVKWNKFKVDYGLATTNNPYFGYNTGYVPSLFLLNGSGDAEHPAATFQQGAVYFNDAIEKVGEQFKVADSYYTSERASKLAYLEGVGTSVLKDRIVPASDVDSITFGEDTYYFWNQDAAASYHTPLVKAFLDYSVQRVTHTGF